MWSVPDIYMSAMHAMSYHQQTWRHSFGGMIPPQHLSRVNLSRVRVVRRFGRPAWRSAL